MSIELNERFSKMSFIRMKYYGLEIIITDERKWVPDMTLKQACADYNVETPKMDVNILEYNRVSVEQGKLLVTCDDITPYMKGMTMLEKMKLKKNPLFFKDNKWNILDIVIRYCKRRCNKY